MKPTDFKALFSFYDRINKERPLQPHEEERVAALVRKQQMAEKDRRYYLRNREKRLAYAAEYRKANPESSREASRRWRAKQAKKPFREA